MSMADNDGNIRIGFKWQHANVLPASTEHNKEKR